MLVERIINKVLNEDVDIDKILVVTFTNAAASEMRERILDAIYKKIEEEPDNIKLQRQITLLNKASICTIHSFCLDVIRNNFYEIDTSANFRIGDTAEVEMLKSDVLDEIFEQKYLDSDKGFITLIETYTDYRGDEKLANLVLDIYKYIQSAPWPEEWLESKVESFNLKKGQDFSSTIWGQVILDDIKSKIDTMIVKLQNIKNETLRFDELSKFSNVLEEDIVNLKSINLSTWDMAYNSLNSVSWSKWPIDKKATLDLKNTAKEVRDKVKKEFAEIVPQYTSDEAIQDISYMYEILKELKNLILEFCKKYAEAKKEKNIIDFNDIEHFALKILTANGSNVADKYREKFEEILIDEYQDSNLVQEKILGSISRGNNIFMVGDVKQSIYKFRQARPELFLEKYDKYSLRNDNIEKSTEFINKDVNTNINTAGSVYESGKPNGEKIEGLKIQLFKNFRSRENVLDLTNLIFENIMSKSLGNVNYNEEEFLNYGANFPENKYAGIAELNIIDDIENEDLDYETDDSINDIEEENGVEHVENSVLEAKFVASRIKKLLDSDYQVYDKKVGYRKVMPKDICVLLRATSVLAPIYEKEISELNLPVFSDSSNTYLESMEVETIMSLLKVIDNPMQDIPLVTVLRSNIFGFTDNDLIEIRMCDRKCVFYDAMLKARISVNNDLRHKIDNMVELLKKWKSEEKYTPLAEFIWKIYLDTGFFNYVSLLPNGNLRQANLKMLFEKAKQFEKASFKGLFNFINFINKVKTSSGDLSSAKIIGENDNVIRIMSIHKSKGLEFPIVFLASTGKKFNLRDLNTPILMHQDLGLGVQYIDYEKRLEYSTLSKEAIRLVSKKETISEEMRVLYVALTRAKEKLIITGMKKNFNEDLKKKEKVLEIMRPAEESEPYNLMHTDKDNKQINHNLHSNRMNNGKLKIHPSIIEKYTSYSDWIEIVYLYNKENVGDTLDLHVYNKKEIMKNMQEEEERETDVLSAIKEKTLEKDGQISEDIISKLKWKYKYLASSEIPTKTSVSKLKQMEEGLDIDDLIDEAKKKMKLYNNTEAQSANEEHVDAKEENLNTARTLNGKPKFLENTQRLSAAEKGTLIHLCVQKLDEKRNYTSADIKEFVDDLYRRNIISQNELKNINTEILYKYTQSSLFKELKEAKEIHKEEPFYINLSAKDIFDEAADNEMILVQGIIDLYYIDKNGNLILVDYKTDYVPDGNLSKLEEKYKIQLELYKNALEGALGRKVDKAMIWALNN